MRVAPLKLNFFPVALVPSESGPVWVPLKVQVKAIPSGPTIGGVESRTQLQSGAAVMNAWITFFWAESRLTCGTPTVAS
jgi:hypothetical protein